MADTRNSMATIQSYDFSQKLPSESSGRRGKVEQNQNTTALSRFIGWGFALAILIFTAGILAGLKIAEMRSIEKQLVKYPDGKSTSFANVASEKPKEHQPEERHIIESDTSLPKNQSQNHSTTNSTASDSRADLIIRIGAFSPKRAGELARSLNQLPELKEIPFQPCRGVEDLNPERLHVFSVPVKPDVLQKDNAKNATEIRRLFAGCYSSKEDAKRALDILHNTGVATLSESRVYELE